MILVSLNDRSCLIFALQIELSLSFFLIIQVFLVPFHHRSVFIAALLDLISEFGVLLRYPDLPLQSLLLVVQLADPVLEHLSLFQNEPY